jgi:altronate dehydratase
MSLWTGEFWKQTAERSIKTAAQFGLVAFGGNLTNAWTLDPWQVTGAVAAGAVMSVFTSIASLPFGPSDSPSVVE